MADGIPSGNGNATAEGPGNWPSDSPTVGQLIVETLGFRVYLTEKDEEVWWDTTSAHDALGIATSDCQSKISYLESQPTKHLDAEVKRAFRCQLGEAMVFALRGEAEKSDRMLDTAREFYVGRSQECARRTFVISTAVTVAVVAVISATLWCVSELRKWGIADLSVIHVGVGSSLGALLFSLNRLNKTAIDPYAETKSHIIEAIARVIVSLIVGVMAICAVRGGFLMPQLIKDGYGFFLLCLLAGASEKFGGSLVEHFDQMFGKAVASAAKNTRTRTLPKKPIAKTKAAGKPQHDGHTGR